MKHFNSSTHHKQEYNTTPAKQKKSSVSKQGAIYYDSYKKDEKTCLKCEIGKNYLSTEEKVKSRETEKESSLKETLDETLINKVSYNMTSEESTRRKKSQNMHTEFTEQERVRLGAGINLTSTKSTFNKRIQSNMYYK